MSDFLYDRAKNAVKVGYELNRTALILHLFVLLDKFYYSAVIGIMCIVLSNACVYFGESIRCWNKDENAAPQLTLACMLLTILSYCIWILNRFIWR